MANSFELKLSKSLFRHVVYEYCIDSRQRQMFKLWAFSNNNLGVAVGNSNMTSTKRMSVQFKSFWRSNDFRQNYRPITNLLISYLLVVFPSSHVHCAVTISAVERIQQRQCAE